MNNMKNKKIIIAGGTGFIGEAMTNYFGKNNSIIILTRAETNNVNNRNHFHALSREVLENVRYIKWDGKAVDKWSEMLDGADMIINMAGRTVNCRYNTKNKKEIFDSRTDAVHAIGEAIRQCKNPPPLWINASSATIYRHAADRPQDEYTGEYHNDFSVQVCRKWEAALYAEDTPATRKVALRMAITLGAGGVLIPYFNLLKFGLGGSQGNGRQMYSWVHITDTCRMIAWIESHPKITGAYNCCAPHPVTNEVFMSTLRKATGHKFGLPAPAWLLQLGAPLIGTETELVLKSRWVIPTKITATGFRFSFPHLEEALQDIIKSVPRKQYHLF